MANAAVAVERGRRAAAFAGPRRIRGRDALLYHDSEAGSRRS